MAKDGIPAVPSKRADDVEAVPARTLRVYDACMGRFSDLLSTKSACKMRERNSQTPTDADIEDAYRELTHLNTPGPVARCVGDGAMILGALLMPYWTAHPMLTVCGILLCGMGLYVREFSKKWG